MPPRAGASTPSASSIKRLNKKRRLAGDKLEENDMDIDPPLPVMENSPPPGQSSTSHQPMTPDDGLPSSAADSNERSISGLVPIEAMEWLGDSDNEFEVVDEDEEWDHVEPPDGLVEEEKDWEDDENGELEVTEELERIIREYEEQARNETVQEYLASDPAESDVNGIIFFNLRLYAHISRKIFDYIRFHFEKQLSLQSLYQIHRRIGELAGLKEVTLPCCINSCVCFSGEFEELDSCPECGEAKLDVRNRPRSLYRYLPLAPRFDALYKSEIETKALLYRAQYQHQDGVWGDVLDGRHYQNLCTQRVQVGTTTLEHRFFDQDTDIAFGLMTDGFRVFKRQRGGSASCWPIIALIYNYSPLIRSRLSNIFPVSLIPGPKAPKNFNSYFAPLVDECKQLATGVPAYRATNRGMVKFSLRAYPLNTLGDMPAIKHCSGMKGPNSIHPCRACEIKGFRDASKPRSPYYVPHSHPGRPDAHGNRMGFPVHNLPLRTEAKTELQLTDIENAASVGERKHKRMSYGLNERSALMDIPSLLLTRSFPHEWLHLMLENHAKNLVLLWQGKMNGLKDIGEGQFRIADIIWEQIGKDTVAAGDFIPSAFGRRTPNIWLERFNFTGEDWSFWFLYLAPYLLKGRFPEEKYYEHFLSYHRILHMTLQRTITRDEISTLRDLIRDYVSRYEEIYYQYKIERLPLCPLTLHALLHIPDDIKMNGPMCYTWSWVMERWCGILGPAVKSRSKPYASLALRQLHLAQIQTIRARYDFHDHLRLVPPRDPDAPSKREECYSESDYPASILRSPRIIGYQPPDSILNKIARYLASVLNQPHLLVRTWLPTRMIKWGKVRVVAGGDKFTCHWVEAQTAGNVRSASYVRFHLLDQTGEPVCSYGRLEMILDFVLHSPPSATGRSTEKRYLLAGITACRTNDKDATIDATVTYRDMDPSLRIVDLNSIGAVIGRVRVNLPSPHWGIIDRSSSLAVTVFRDEEELGFNDDEDSDEILDLRAEFPLVGFSYGAGPPENATRGDFPQCAVSEITQLWAGTVIVQGQSIVPCVIPAGTVLYHARYSANVPKVPEWVAFDYEHSYSFDFGPHSHMFTLGVRSSPKSASPSRPAGSGMRVLLFDGLSAHWSPDTQEIVMFGEIRNDDASGGMDPAKTARLARLLCAWGEKNGIDGFVRMEEHFELIACDFEKSFEVLSIQEMLPKQESINRNATDGEEDDDDDDWEHRCPPKGWLGSLPTDVWTEVDVAGKWHDFFPGETRLRPVYSKFVTFYDPAVTSLLPFRRGQAREFHRLSNVTKTEAGMKLRELEDAVGRPWPGNGDESGSGVDWGSEVHVVVERYGSRLELLNRTLSAEAETKTGAQMSAFKARQQVLMMLAPHITPLDVPPSSFASGGTSSKAWLSPIYDRCATRHTQSLHDPTLTSRYTPQESLILEAIEDVMGEICRRLVRMFDISFSMEKPSSSPSAGALESNKMMRATDVVRVMRGEIVALTSWLDWVQVWVKCRPACSDEEMCMAVRPVIQTPASSAGGKAPSANALNRPSGGRRDTKCVPRPNL